MNSRGSLRRSVGSVAFSRLIALTGGAVSDYPGNLRYMYSPSFKRAFFGLSRM